MRRPPCRNATPAKDRSNAAINELRLARTAIQESIFYQRLTAAAVYN